jgi:predicted metal-dependent hydrolase
MDEIPIDLIRSKRRKRTVQAVMSDGRLEVRIPDGLDPNEETRLVEQVTERALRKITSSHIDLTERARRLARRYGLPQPVSIEWSTRQAKRWGSCTPDEGRIRISNRLASMPAWVLDSVLVHELAHLEAPDHGPRFRALIERYELTERATGYLMAVSEGRSR